jgi:hemerythrin superfamily protein
MTTAKADKGLLQILVDEHNQMKQLYNEFLNLRDKVEKEKIKNELIRMISMHDAIENVVLYPVVKKDLGEEVFHQSQTAHRQVRSDLYLLDKRKVDDPGFNDLLGKIMKELMDHIRDEETHIFPRLQEMEGQESIKKLGLTLERARMTAPTHPHPNAPDTMPAVAVTGAAAAVFDSIRDQGRVFRSS